MNQMELARAAARFSMPRASRSLGPYGHFAAMVFSQLTCREGLRGIEVCLRGRRPTWLHLTPAVKRILQHLAKRRAVQIWPALCAYLLVAIARQREHLPHSLWEILQIVSIASMEQVPLDALLANFDTRNDHFNSHSQLEFNYS